MFPAIANSPPLDQLKEPYMNPDDHVCLCFHVTRRKIVNYIRVERPRRVSQISECGGAGTGCGWCRPFLGRLFEQHSPGNTPPNSGPLETGNRDQGTFNLDELSPQQYAEQRKKYVDDGKGTPPG